MQRTLDNKILETEVEEALVSNPNYLTRLLALESEFTLIARQLRLRSGEHRLDLLGICGKELCLVELKVTVFQAAFIDQISSYRQEILELQTQGNLPMGTLRAYLLVTGCGEEHLDTCRRRDIQLIQYSPSDVLREYFRRLASAAPFLTTKPSDYGVFSLGLIHRSLGAIQAGWYNESEIASQVGLARSSVHNHLRIARELGLIRERGTRYFLTDLGDKYVEAGGSGALFDALTDEQATLLRRHIADDPFASGTVFGIYAIVEAVFLLARNAYPVPLADVRRLFVTVSGKESGWRADKSKATATYTFLNYAIDLGLLGKMGHDVLITPTGIRFILMLQLHKSIKMIDTIT